MRTVPRTTVVTLPPELWTEFCRACEAMDFAPAVRELRRIEVNGTPAFTPETVERLLRDALRRAGTIEIRDPDGECAVEFGPLELAELQRVGWTFRLVPLTRN